MATLKPTTPLRATNKGPLKPTSPLHPKTAPRTPISHPQRRWRFHSHTGISEQRRWRFQTTGPAGLQGLAATPARSYKPTPQKTRMQFDWERFQQRLKTLQFQRSEFKTRSSRRGIACEIDGRQQSLAGLRADAPSNISDQAPLVWRAPEGLEGLAAVPVGGGGAWPGFETTRRAKLAARTARGRAAAHGHIKQPGPAGCTKQPGPAGCTKQPGPAGNSKKS